MSYKAFLLSVAKALIAQVSSVQKRDEEDIPSITSK
jgi:hypothetical protein